MDYIIKPEPQGVLPGEQVYNFYLMGELDPITGGETYRLETSGTVAGYIKIRDDAQEKIDAIDKFNQGLK